jgi:aspartate 1-decarboxylase
MRQLMRSKIHRATVTDCNEEYIGSIVVDEDLMDHVDIWNHEKVLVCDINNGSRFETYVIPGPRGNGDISIQGAAAKLSGIGHKVIIMAFEVTEDPIQPLSILVDGRNRFVEYLEGAPNVAQVL